MELEESSSNSSKIHQQGHTGFRTGISTSIFQILVFAVTDMCRNVTKYKENMSKETNKKIIGVVS